VVRYWRTIGLTLLSLLLLACQPATRLRPDAATQDLAAIQQARVADPVVKMIVRGVLLRLDDTQVRDRPGRHSSFYDYCGDRTGEALGAGGQESVELWPDAIPELTVAEHEAETCRSRVYVTLPVSKRFVGVSAFDLPIENEIGEWSTYLGIVPALRGSRKGRLFVALQDSSMFVTAAVGYPLFLLEPKPQARITAEILTLARDHIAGYRRGDGYNFWRQRPAQTAAGGTHAITYPNNLPPRLVEKVGRRYLAEPELFDPAINPYGADSAFNIPNDADDTATAVAFELLYRAHGGYPGAAARRIHEDALEILPRYRDLDREREDGHDAWKGTDSGAFLTWLKDEREPPFARPGAGVIPRDVNNVDCVVNANAVLALALAGKRETPGFDQAVELSARAVRQTAWPECGLYYPQRLIFPYAVSRAYRDGGVRAPVLVDVLGKLMTDVMLAQSDAGWFDGGADKGRDLSTALGVVTLLNLGEAVARRAGIPLEDYRSAIRLGLAYLADSARAVPVENPDTFARDGVNSGAAGGALAWEPGVFFASVFWDLVQWRSEAYTDAIVLEAFVRYALAYDRYQEGIRGPYRLGVDERTFDLTIVDKKRAR